LNCLTFYRNIQTPVHAPPVQKLKDALSSRMTRFGLWRMVIHSSRQYIGLFFKRQSVFRPLKMGSVDSPETSVSTFRHTPRNISEERRPLIHSDASLKSSLQDAAVCPHVVFHTLSKVTEITSLKAID